VNRRKFITHLGFGATGIVLYSLYPGRKCIYGFNERKKLKNWAWISTNLKLTDYEWQTMFARMRRAGIDAILPEIFDSQQAYYASRHLPVGEAWLERILPLAKQEDLEVHAWMWSMPCNIPEIQTDHPEWFCVNRNGDSCLDKPAYVDYYRFLCPSRIEVQDFIQRRVEELACYDELDGIHLDYIRYPDVIIAEALQPKYNIIQDREYPEFDYCYCDVCRENFKEQADFDPLEMKDPSLSVQWRQFRYDTITSLVNNRLVPIAKKYGRQITAAVFPNWEAVRQQWMTWNLDGFLPMLYHNFYNGDLKWIRDQTGDGVAALNGQIPLYSGLFVPELNPDELLEAIKSAVDAGAGGYALFHGEIISEEHWHLLGELTY
jgi:uncharacterized lipoprotein YddW (UPF0748 family)